MALRDLTADAVVKAMDLCDELGEEEFLTAYSYKPARQYLIVRKGTDKTYPSKAIAGVANKFVRDGWPVLKAKDFSGGERTVKNSLRKLGFEFTTVGSARNPRWLRDELMLALDLYLTNPSSPPSKTSPQVAELSSLLEQLGTRLGLKEGVGYRNANGVYMKMMNFRRFDPAFLSTGRVGLSRGSKADKQVWDEFAADEVRRKLVVHAIKATLSTNEDINAGDEGEDDTEAPEGRLLTRLHRVRERNRKIVQKRKRIALEKTGRLACEVCDFDYHKHYGPLGHGFIEAHHILPLHTLAEPKIPRLDDLALVCANCHRMIHSERQWLEIVQLREIVANLRS